MNSTIQNDSENVCPRCLKTKCNVVFKVWLDDGDTYICEDCFNEIEEEEEDSEEEDEEEN
jgi:DNA-directed RNA polymerase subunit RPC12/RpoP